MRESSVFFSCVNSTKCCNTSRRCDNIDTGQVCSRNSADSVFFFSSLTVIQRMSVNTEDSTDLGGQ